MKTCCTSRFGRACGLMLFLTQTAQAQIPDQIFDSGFETPPVVGLDRRPDNNGCLAAPQPGSGESDFPQRLSETGCFNPQDPTQPVGALIPYDLNAPFWSNDARKQRYFAIPDGTQIAVGADGDWDLPVGSVVVKSFLLNDKLVETRLMMRHDDGDWAGYSYEWNTQQTDATLLPAGKTKVIDGQTYIYPSRSECLQCHTDVAGRTLGLENQQLNRDLRYPRTDRSANQLDTLNHIRLFEQTLPPASSLPALPTPIDASAPLDGRARAYLHSNCSYCHRPDGPGAGDANMLYTVSLADMNVCDAGPIRGSLGVDGARLIVPGDPSKSIISLRMKTLNVNAMPPLAKTLADPLGTSLVDVWINSINACP